jgi:hypothetical protein
MAFQTSGKVHKIMEAQQITDRFRKREFVLEVQDGRYPQLVVFQLTGDRCEVLDGYGIGDDVGVDFDIRGREWTSPKGEVRYFVSLEVWRIGKGNGNGRGHLGADDPPPMTDDDLPF